MTKHTEYTLQVRGTISAPAGLHSKVLRLTDEAAMADAAELAKSFHGVRWFMSVTVWQGDDRIVGTVSLDEPVLTVTARLGGKVALAR
jgi:hypothetical protein